MCYWEETLVWPPGPLHDNQHNKDSEAKIGLDALKNSGFLVYC